MEVTTETCDVATQTTPPVSASSREQENMHILWNICLEIEKADMTTLPSPVSDPDFYERITVGDRKASTIQRTMRELLSGRSRDQLLTPVWVLFSMLREACRVHSVDLQDLLSGTRKRFNLGDNAQPASKKSKESCPDSMDNAAPAALSDTSNTLVFRLLDRCSGCPPSQLTDQLTFCLNSPELML